MTPLLLLALAAPAGAPEEAKNISWIQNDWKAARVDAARNDRYMFIDVWATWCHTCMTMKQEVLGDRRLNKYRDAYTWLSIDSDREQNATFIDRFPVNAVPTFLIIDAKGGVHARTIGAHSVAEIMDFLERGRAVYPQLARLERQLARGHYQATMVKFAALVDDPKLPAKDRPRAWAGYIESLLRKDPQACAEQGIRALKDLGPRGHSLEVIGLISVCGNSQPDDRKKAVATAIRDHLRKWGPAARKLNVDDRSTWLGLLYETSQTLGDPAARKYLRERLALLEMAATRAPTAAARAAFDPHRLEVYFELGQHERALRMLKASEAAQPDSFNHPWRLATVYLEDGDTDNGLAAINRALARGYGGRKLRLYTTKLDLLIQAQRWDEAAKVVAAADAELAKWEPAQVRRSWRRKYRERRRTVRTTMKKKKSP